MLGEHFLFVPGPSHVPESIQRAMHRSMDDHRSPLFPELVLPLLEDIKKVFIPCKWYGRLGSRHYQYVITW